jgi:hypothetical protein
MACRCGGVKKPKQLTKLFFSMSHVSPVDSAKEMIDKNINHRLNLYSAAAAAAGVSILALAQPAEGEVVVTHKTIPIPASVYGGIQHLVPIDLNNDGVKDFSFSLYEFAYHGFINDLHVEPVEGGAVVASHPPGAFYASALVRGARIGPSAHFSSNGRAEIEVAQGFDASSIYSRRLYGNWGGNPLNRYLGVRFLINGATHYGWVRLAVITEPRGLAATITEYAYETIANKPIQAGSISGNSDDAQVRKEDARGGAWLGMLALGANGLALWRREEGVASTRVIPVL